MNETTNSEIIKSFTGATCRPECTYYHANMKCTGAALRLTLHPARPDHEGAIMATFAPQSSIACITNGVRTFARFDWENAVTVKLTRDDIAKMLEVLIECEEFINDDKGLYHCSTKEATVIKLRHVLEPMPGYLFEVFRRDRATDAESHVGIFLSPSEALGLARAIEGAMVYVMFGVPSCL